MAPRSRTGCLTCRSRKLKCDESQTPSRPTCANCIKANRNCVPSQGITFRHQQNPSMNGKEQDGLKSFYGYKETFAKSTTWVQVPQDLTFVHTSNPYEDEEGEDIGALSASAHMYQEPSVRDHSVTHDFNVNPASYSAYASHGLEALSAVATDRYATQMPALNGHQRTPSHTSVQPVTTSGLGLDFILNPASQNVSPVSGGTHSNIDPQLHAHSPTGPLKSPTHVRNPSFASAGGRTSLQSFQGTQDYRGRTSIQDPELAYLLRQATEHTLCWMDLFDLDLFFAAKVPVLAVSCPLLLYSCASLSAKSLARVDGRRHIMGGATSQQSKMELWPGQPMDAEQWMRKGRECYDIAVSLLRQSLAGASGTRPGTSSLPDDATPATLSTIQGMPLPTTDSDELVAATAILCVYEFIDASGPEWSRHLDGAKTLFDVAREQAVPLTLPPSPQSIAEQISQQLSRIPGSEAPRYMPAASRGLSLGRRAVFWCFARQDMLSAFINNTSTRLDTADLAMWRSVGLQLTVDGFVMPSHPDHENYSEELAMGDDMISNALVWLLMKLVNFIAAGDEVPQSISPLSLGVRQRDLLSYWEELDAQLAVWYEGVTDGFRSTAVRSSSAEWETEKWFARSMAASTIQWYHFARVQLLHNKPHLSTARPDTHVVGGAAAPGTGLASRHASYASIIQESRQHAKEIVAIARSRGDEAMRVHSVQPLWTAGLVLGRYDNPTSSDSHNCTEWRRTIIDLLRGIEHDMGWAAEYRVQGLLELWEATTDVPPVAV
ncbi:Putative zn(2)-C6 fungal-type DNA-binding domain, fungal transcription factor [Septoria linicola]|uniref:Zn(2)-C6 fungal-type DNA-binding domain, fungal transcription factor n=1 Tax=Septoria linicola TaxID=215465 RepID=A0A9Q9AKZ0_9PEZI|nr:putative zn(2)-C6 fungal-type DNA-binding domain, fungal transcription factor [Septoria linicola]USW47967.1 Putative zn(2)-C6 fungal-type DNA-binding domain, fungal transcription factor [Septoria linicola]